MTKVFYNSTVAKMLLCFSPCHTIMLGGFVFSKQRESEMTQSTRNHESVHARQWVEMTILSGMVILALVLWLGISPWWMLLSGATFYVWYVIEWMCKGIYYSIMNDEWDCPSNKLIPYREISFDREARLANNDNNYLENSSYFSWIKYIWS